VTWIDVLDGGMLTTVQDLGRVGSQKYGVPESGAMDGLTLRAANRLVGNADSAACLEMTLTGPELRFGGPVVIALTGADLGALVNGRPAARWQAVSVAADTVLTFGGVRDGMRAYLAVNGGIDVPLVLGSRSTFTRSALGGFEGRALCAGDRIPVGAASGPPRGPGRLLPRHAVPLYGHAHSVRVVMGPQDDAFTDEGIRTFLAETYTLSTQSDRIGCRLSGPRIAHRTGADIVSDGTTLGSVQVTGDGLPIVLMADRGTTGGYAKIATVTSVDVSRLAQAMPGDRITFVRIGLDEAHALLRGAHAWLDAIRRPGAEEEDPAAIYDEDSGAALAAEGCVGLASALGGRRATRASGRDMVRAGMPGVVVSVAVGPGDEVAERQTLLVIEAMKMHSPLRSPRAGRVGRVLVTPGALVEAGTDLIEFDGTQARDDDHDDR
jgi:biotin-dependent carboxylase-like uncharacterized protein